MTGTKRDEGDIDDVAPGIIDAEPERVWSGIQVYLIGLGLAGLLTVASFYVAGTDLIWGPAIPMALVALAIAQMGVHLVFFLHLTSDPDNANNVIALLFGILIVALLVGGSIWIMGHLNQNMMPTPQLMMMQR